MDKKDIDKWWKEFETADLDKQILLVKEVCNLKLNREFYEEFGLGDAIFEYIREENLGNKDEIKYYELLEEIMGNYPEAFDKDSFWFLSDLIFYNFKNRPEKIKEYVKYLIENPKEEPDILLDMIDFLIVNSFLDEAWSLLKAYYPYLSKGKSTMAGGVNELAVLSSFFIISRYKEQENYDVESIKKELSSFDIVQKKEILNERINILLNKDYKYKMWNIEETKKTNNKYFLTLEFSRYLTEKNIDFILANYLGNCIIEYFFEEDGNLLIFNEKKIDAYIASWVGFLSIRKTKSLAILTSFILFYDFIFKRGLIDSREYNKINKILIGFKDALFKGVFNEYGDKYFFVERILNEYYN